ncbi:MAG: DUF4212 domain-containing protein [Planctomycetota bacterium]
MPDKPVPPGERTTENIYWLKNIRLVSILLAIWFVAGFVLSIFFIDVLNGIKIGNVGLGFWMAQQGSIYIFVVLVLVYALLMDRIDRSAEGADD